MKAIISPKPIKSCLTATLCCSEMSRESVQLLLADVFLLQGKKSYLLTTQAIVHKPWMQFMFALEK